MNNYKELKVWQKSIDLTLNIYNLSKKFPDHEKYAIVQQINRCVVSIPSNIAEGAGRSSNKEFSHFLSISLGSSFELETLLVISLKLSYINHDEYENVYNDLQEIQKMIFGLKKSLTHTKD